MERPVKSNVSRSQKHAGRHGPKAKSGCKTCKRRKVKCDEARPACARCLKTGVACEGYGIWGGGNASGQDLKQSYGYSQSNLTIDPLPSQTLSQEPLPTTEFENDYRREITPHPATTISGRSPCQLIDGEIMNELHARRAKTTEELHGCDANRQSLGTVLSVRPCFPDDPEQRTLFDWYLSVTSWKLPGTFTSTFWTTLLPQASHSQPAVLYGVLALASAHRTASLLPPKPEALEDEQRTLISYNKAMQYLCSQHLSTHVRDARSINVTLITCILFICLEMVRRRFKLAAAHLSSGVKLLRQYDKNNSVRNGSDDGTMQLIEQTLFKLSLQVDSFGNPSRSGFSKPQQDLARPPTIFHTVEEAREYLDTLQNRVAALRERSQGESMTEDQPDGPSFDLDGERDTIREGLRNWLASYAASRFEHNPLLPERNKAATIVLRMSYQVAVISTEVCRCPPSELLYDEHTTRFLYIVNDATKLWSAVRTSHRQRPPTAPHFLGETHAMVLDIGYIPAAYFVALKCRVREIRLRAIYLLEHTYHTEGAWDASTCARVAREVMSLEEGLKAAVIEGDERSYDAREPLTLANPESSTIPEGDRLSDVEMILPDVEDDVIKFRYWKMEGESKYQLEYVVNRIR